MFSSTQEEIERLTNELEDSQVKIKSLLRRNRELEQEVGGSTAFFFDLSFQLFHWNFDKILDFGI